MFEGTSTARLEILTHANQKGSWLQVKEMGLRVATSGHILEGRPVRDRLSMRRAGRSILAEQRNLEVRNSLVEERSRVAVRSRVEGRKDLEAPAVVVLADRTRRWGAVEGLAGVAGTIAPVEEHPVAVGLVAEDLAEARLVAELDVADIYDLVAGSLVGFGPGLGIVVRCN